MSCVTISGVACAIRSQAVGLGCAGRWTTAASGRRCSGGPARADAGATCPTRLGDHRAVRRRYDRWIERGVLDAMLAALSADADLDQLLLDAAIVRAHQHAAGARLVTGGAQAQGLGRSRGGPTTQIHAACDGLGNPVRPPFEPGQRNDVPQAHAVIEGLAPEAGIADKGWDADPSHDAVLDAGTEPVIPPGVIGVIGAVRLPANGIWTRSATVSSASSTSPRNSTRRHPLRQAPRRHRHHTRPNRYDRPASCGSIGLRRTPHRLDVSSRPRPDRFRLRRLGPERVLLPPRGRRRRGSAVNLCRERGLLTRARPPLIIDVATTLTAVVDRAVLDPSHDAPAVPADGRADQPQLPCCLDLADALVGRDGDVLCEAAGQG